MIEVQESTEPLRGLDRAVVVPESRFGIDQRVAEPLMMTLSVVVFDELLNDQPEMLLSQGDDVIETLSPNGSDEALRESFDARVAQDGGEVFGEEGVAIMNDVAMPADKAGLRGDVGDLHAPGFKVDDEEHEVADETSARQDLDRKEVAGRDRAP